MQRLAPQADSSRVPVSHHARRAARGPERAMRDYPRPSPCQGVADVVRGPLSGVWGCVGARAPPPGDRAAVRLAAPPDAKCSVITGKALSFITLSRARHGQRRQHLDTVRDGGSLLPLSPGHARRAARGGSQALESCRPAGLAAARCCASVDFTHTRFMENPSTVRVAL